MQQSVHCDMKAFTNKNISLSVYDKIEISGKDMDSPSLFKYTDDNEFIYNGKLYDIVSTEKDGVNTIFYCLNDKKEERLFAGLNIHIKNNCDQNGPSKDKALQLIKNIIKEALPDTHCTLKTSQIFTYIFSDSKSELAKQFIPVNAHPPKA